METTVQIALEFPVEALSALRTTHQEFAKELKCAAVCKWYENGLLSQSKAAFMLGISRADFMMLLGRFGGSPFQTTVDELEAEVGDG
jgi:predicted HTH domain antitoxin